MNALPFHFIQIELRNTHIILTRIHLFHKIITIITPPVNFSQYNRSQLFISFIWYFYIGYFIEFELHDSK